MIALILFLLMGPPPFVSGYPIRESFPEQDETRCAGLPEVEWRKCQPRMVNLGTWDVRPSPEQWPYNYTAGQPTVPEAWGTYETEKRE